MAPRVGLDRVGLVLGARGAEPTRSVPLVSGAIHYWRLDPAHWTRCLTQMAELGLRIVETYVPWRVHEKVAGGYDFRSRALDLGAFLDRVADAGLYAIVRPGPHINAEITDFGFPDRIVRDQRMWARSATGTPVYLPAPPRMFPVPSYHSRVFQAETRDWLAMVGQVVSRRRWPNGPVVAAQVDNEAQMFFRIGAYDHDYHPEALADFHEWSGGMDAPRRWDPGDEPRCLRWVAWKDQSVAQAIAWCADAMRDAGLGDIPFLHNLPPTDPELVNLPCVEAALGEGGVAGLDFYHRRQDLPMVLRRAAYLDGSARQLPYAPELGLGGPLWLPPMSREDQEETVRAVLAAGVRAMNLYMVVDRDRWYGAPIGPDGTVRPDRAGFVRRLLQALDLTSFAALRRPARAAIVLSRAHRHLATASSLMDPISPVILEMLETGGAGAAAFSALAAPARHRRMTNALCAALDRLRVPVALVDPATSAERLAEFPLVIVPTVERVDRGLWRRLRGVVARGAHVVYGPDLPARDEWGLDLGGDAAPPEGALRLDEDDLAHGERVAQLAGGPAETWASETEGAVGWLHVDDAGAPKVFFLSNATAAPLGVAARAQSGAQLIDAFSGERLTADGEGRVAVPLAAFSVRMFRVA